MIDVHCHILPGLDDGASSLGESLEMARVAIAAGVSTIVATPHIRDDHPFDPERIPALVEEVNAAARDAGIGIVVETGGEVSLTKVPDLTDEELQRLTLARGSYLLVESPYGAMTDMFETQIFDLQTRGFAIVLAHPERSPSLIADFGRLQALAERDVLFSVTAASMAGALGRAPQRMAIDMLRAGLVHNVASDAHDPARRRPELRPGFEALEQRLPGLLERMAWYTDEVPRAMLASAPLPPAPEALPGRGRLSRLLGRR